MNAGPLNLAHASELQEDDYKLPGCRWAWCDYYRLVGVSVTWAMGFQLYAVGRVGA